MNLVHGLRVPHITQETPVNFGGGQMSLWVTRDQTA